MRPWIGCSPCLLIKVYYLTNFQSSGNLLLLHLCGIPETSLWWLIFDLFQFSKILEKVFVYDQLVLHLLNVNLIFDFHHTLYKMFSYMLLTAGVELLIRWWKVCNVVAGYLDLAKSLAVLIMVSCWLNWNNMVKCMGSAYLWFESYLFSLAKSAC